MHFPPKANKYDPETKALQSFVWTRFETPAVEKAAPPPWGGPVQAARSDPAALTADGFSAKCIPLMAAMIHQ